MASLMAGTIREALRLAQGVGAGEIELRAGEDTFAAKFARWSPAPEASETEAAPEAAAGPTIVRSTHVGYFHPVEPPLESGAPVKEGTVLGIVESLGLANDVVAGGAGTFGGYLVEDGAPVEFGQGLAEIAR